MNEPTNGLPRQFIDDLLEGPSGKDGAITAQIFLAGGGVAQGALRAHPEHEGVYELLTMAQEGAAKAYFSGAAIIGIVIPDAKGDGPSLYRGN